MDGDHNFASDNSHQDYEYEDYYDYPEDYEALAAFGSKAEQAEIILNHRLNNHNMQNEVSRLVKSCMGSVLYQGVQQVKVIFIVCFSLQVTAKFLHHFDANSLKIKFFLHLLSCWLGLYVLYDVFNDIFSSVKYVIFIFIILTYLSNLIFSRWLFQGKSGLVTSFLTIAYILLNEMLFSEVVAWNRIRGVLLLMSMKIISVSINYDNKSFSLPNLLEYFSYCLHPGTLVFGPWISIHEFNNSILSKRQLNLEWGICIIKCIFLSAVCLLLSDCVLPYIFINPMESHLPIIIPVVANQWMLSYEAAVSFHFSHYYVCYLATTTCLLSGVGAMKSSDKKLKSDDDTKNHLLNTFSWSKLCIVKPLDIEIPHSMLNVVVSWNIPMSKWLKKYVFDTTRFLGDFLAILFTYAISAMLHGLSIHLALILLSLAFYTYTEHALRKRLAHVFNCPAIEAKPHISNSSMPSSIWVKLHNIVWVFINIMHLSYLGSMFYSEDEENDIQGYSLRYTILKWSNLGYLSHIFAMFCLICSWLI